MKARRVPMMGLDIKVLHPLTRKRHQKELDSARALYEDKDLMKRRSINEHALRRKIAYLERVLELGTPVKPKGATVTRLMKEKKMLEEKLKFLVNVKHKMTGDALEIKENGGRLLQCQAETNPIRERLRQINYTLDQDDPTTGNLERFRQGGAEGRRTMPIPGMAK